MKRKLAPREVCGLIILAVFCAALFARREGWLQFLEFRAYDFFLRQAPLLPSGDPIVLVEMTESDIQSPDLDYPLTDEKMAELLEKLAQAEPAVIGLDIWRDVPVPKSRLYLTNLNRAFLQHTNIIGIYTLGGTEIAPPPALMPYPDRLGFNDNFPVDDGVEKTTPKVRRTWLFEKAQSGQRLDSFPFRVASVYLTQHGVNLGTIGPDPVPFRFGRVTVRPLSPNDGPYVRANTVDAQILMDFKHPGEFTSFTVSEALAGRIPAASLRDKIVLIGINSPSVLDERVTPISYNHKGVEVQSLAILQLLRWAQNGEQFLTFITDWQENIWIIAWCLLGGLIGFRLRSPWKFVTAIIVSMTVLTWVAQQSFATGVWIPLAAPMAAFLPAAALITSYISYQENKDRDHLMRIFANQVSPDIARELWKQREAFASGGLPRAQQLTATILFTDLKGFSTTSEGLNAASLMGWLSEYMDAMAQEVMAHKGVVEKYIGDAIMAVFGAPVARTTPGQIAQDAENAVRCALAMAREMEHLNEIWRGRGMPSCSTRIGIHTGPLVAGTLGGSERSEYTVIGDSVNTASRLESFEKDSNDPNLRDDNCRILISEATRLYLSDNFDLVAVGAISLKGKSEKVTVWRVVAEKNNGNLPLAKSVTH
jgi:adenylate cyclase